MAGEQELLARMERLEKQNKWMRVIMVAVGLLLVGLATMAQAIAPKPINRTLEANEISVKDQKGVVRVRLSVDGLQIFDRWGNRVGNMNEAGIICNMLGSKSIMVFDQNMKARILVNTNNDRAGISIFDKDEEVRTAMMQDAVVVYGHGILAAGRLSSDSVVITDAYSYHATLGVANTVDTKLGTETKTSAATLTLFGKDGKVIWQAP
jgi:hypothetical protein